MVVGLQLILGALLTQASATPSPVPNMTPGITSAPLVRQILIFNQGNTPIFTLRIGGGPDLLSFNQVIDVSEAQHVRVSFNPSACRYDVQASYHDGHVEIQRGVDLCHADRITFKY